MNSSLRRLVIFLIMVGTGTALILYDLPLIFTIALVTAIGFLLLVLLSPATGFGIRDAILNVGKISFIRPQKSGKTFIKIGEHKADEPATVVEFKVEQFEVPQKVPQKTAAEKKEGTSLNRATFASSFKSLGTIFRIRGRPEKNKVRQTDTIPDKTVREKGIVSALARAGELSQDSKTIGPAKQKGPAGTHAGAGSSAPPADDPFLSLSGDEFEPGFLDAAEEDDSVGAGTGPDTPSPDASAPYVPGSSGVIIGESDIPIPPQEVPMEGHPETDEPALANEPDLEEFTTSGTLDTIDQNLDELDTLDLDSVELNDETWEEEPGTGDTPITPIPEQRPLEPEAPNAPGPGAPPGSLPNVPGMAQKAGSLNDMSVFTTPVSADDLLVSALAADIKIAKKTTDLSLVRELKEYTAPAKKIEEELSELYAGLITISAKKTK